MNGPKKLLVVALILSVGGAAAWLLPRTPQSPARKAAAATTVPAVDPPLSDAESIPVERGPLPAAPAAEDVDYRLAPAARQAQKPLVADTYPETSASATPLVEVRRLPKRVPTPNSSAAPGLAERPPFPDPPPPSGLAGPADNGDIVLHRIVDGDTLRGLALKYLRDAERAGEIYAENRQLLADMELLPLGKTLRIRGAQVQPAREE